jgi:hypothetical protein
MAPDARSSFGAVNSKPRHLRAREETVDMASLMAYIANKL